MLHAEGATRRHSDLRRTELRAAYCFTSSFARNPLLKIENQLTSTTVAQPAMPAKNKASITRTKNIAITVTPIVILPSLSLVRAE